MALRLNGSSSGYVELDVPAAAGSHTLTLPDGGGSSGQYLQTDGSGGLSWATGLAQGSVITAGTAVASTSGTSIDFTGIPSWVKRITVMFDGVSNSGTSAMLVQLGDSGGIENTGYKGSGSSLGLSGMSSTTYTTGFGITRVSAAEIAQGTVVLVNLTGNVWAASGLLGRSDSGATRTTAGSKTLSDTLTQVRITYLNGTDTFDAGTINILYEG